MKTLLRVSLAGFLLAGCAAPDPLERPELPVATPEGLVDASDPQPISELAWRYGEASWSRDELGAPTIAARIGDIPYEIEFYGCDEGRDCTDLRFVTRLTVADGGQDAKAPSRQALLGLADRWNRARRFGKVSLGDVPGELIVEMNVTLAGGVTRQNLDQVFDWWRVIMTETREISDI